MTLKLFRVLLVTPVVLLAACGGGGGGSATDDETTVEIQQDDDVVFGPGGIVTVDNETDPADLLPTGGVAETPTEDTPSGSDLLPDSGIMGTPADDQPIVFDGSRPSITNIYTESQIAAIESLGFQINEGNNPPNIEGIFRLESIILTASTLSNDPLTNIAPANIVFENQNNTTLTVDYELDQNNGDAFGVGSFISGSGNAFSVYFVGETNSAGSIHDTTFSFSGTVSNVGIENAQFALFTINDRGNIDVLPTDQGRLFIDLDGFSERLSDAPVSITEPTTQPSEPTEPEGLVISVADIESFSPLFGDVSFVINGFNGEFFSSRTVFSANDVTLDSDDNPILVNNESGLVICQIDDAGDDTFSCTINENTITQASVLITFFGSTGFGNGVLCVIATENCSPEAVAFRLESSPDGQATVEVSSANSLTSFGVDLF